MSDLYAYKTTDPDVIAVVTGMDDAYRTFSDQILTLCGILFGENTERTPIITHWHRQISLAGFSVLKGDPPEGWRIAGRDREFIVPTKRTKSGKALAERLKLSWRRVSVPGMPDERWRPESRGTVITSPSYQIIDGTLYCTWTVNPEPEDTMATGDIDFSVWERCPLSAYYAAKEAIEVDA